MPNELLQKTGDVYAFRVSGSYSPVDPGTDVVGSFSVTANVDLTQAGLTNGQGRQSDKVTLSNVKRGKRWACWAVVDYTGETPTAGASVDYYWLPSTSSVEGTGNIAGNSGIDADAPGGALGSITLAEFIDAGALPIGSLIIHDGSVVQNGFVGYLEDLPSPWGQMLVVNNGGDAFENDDVEMCVVLVEIVDELQ